LLFKLENQQLFNWNTNTIISQWNAAYPHNQVKNENILEKLFLIEMLTFQ